MDILTSLERWYASQCDGDWEHGNGVRITTIDNPGWSVLIDLAETPLESRTFPRVEVDRSEQDWLRCWVEDTTFNGYGGPHNLGEILSRFLSWATSR